MDAAFRAEPLAWKGAHPVGAGAQCALTLHSPLPILVTPSPGKWLPSTKATSGAPGRKAMNPTFTFCPHAPPTTDPILPTTPGVPLVSPPELGAQVGREIHNTEVARGPLQGRDAYLEVPVRRDSQSVTGAAEMLRHGRNKAELASEARDFKGLGGGAEKKGSRGDGAAWATEGTGAPTPQPSQEEPRRREDPRPPATRRRTRRMTYKLSACTWPARQQTCYGLGGLRALWPEHLSTAH